MKLATILEALSEIEVIYDEIEDEETRALFDAIRDRLSWRNPRAIPLEDNETYLFFIPMFGGRLGRYEAKNDAFRYGPGRYKTGTVSCVMRIPEIPVIEEDPE